MCLKEALDIVYVGDRPIRLHDKNNNKYYYNYIYQFEESEEYEKLLSLEVVSIDTDSYGGAIAFYLW